MKVEFISKAYETCKELGLEKVSGIEDALGDSIQINTKSFKSIEQMLTNVEKKEKDFGEYQHINLGYYNDIKFFTIY